MVCFMHSAHCIRKVQSTKRSECLFTFFLICETYSPQFLTTIKNNTISNRETLIACFHFCSKARVLMLIGQDT